MNIFYLHDDPSVAATMQCDRHVPKMVVESLQMLASAARRHGATDNDMPLSESGTPIKGGYAHHPCTLWAGETRDNFRWLAEHGLSLCAEYSRRYGKRHKCQSKLVTLGRLACLIPSGEMTAPVQAMPDDYCDPDPVVAYRRYYRNEKAAIARYDRGTPAPGFMKSA